MKTAAIQAQSPSPVYLIVAPDIFTDELAGFILLQQSRGFEVRIDWPAQPNPTQEDFKAIIQNQIPRPKYVLLVGDDEIIPTWPYLLPSLVEAQTDLLYTTFDGVSDIIPNTILGRLPVHTEEELSAYLVKLSNYYQIEWYPAEGWMKKISFLATDEGRIAASVEANFEKIISDFTEPNGYTGTFTGHEGSPASTIGGDRLFPKTYGATQQDVVDALNNGRVALVFNGTGTATSFEWKLDLPFTTTDVDALTSRPVPLVAAFAPNTADFSASPSMADAWMLNSTSGALTYIGATGVDFYRNGSNSRRRGLQGFVFQL